MRDQVGPSPRRQDGPTRLYAGQHRFYAGIDPHARSLYAHVLDERGRTVLDRDLPASPDAFLDAVKPFRDGLAVGAGCMFAWYWLADLCGGGPTHPLRARPRPVHEGHP